MFLSNLSTNYPERMEPYQWNCWVSILLIISINNETIQCSHRELYPFPEHIHVNVCMHVHKNTHTLTCLMSSHKPTPLPQFGPVSSLTRIITGAHGLEELSGLPITGQVCLHRAARMRLAKYQPDSPLQCLMPLCPHHRHLEGKTAALTQLQPHLQGSSSHTPTAPR